MAGNLALVVDTLDAEEDLAESVSTDGPDLPLVDDTAALGDSLGRYKGLAGDGVGRELGEEVDEVERVLEVLEREGEGGVAVVRPDPASELL